jgi:Uma2 family endonuclease
MSALEHLVPTVRAPDTRDEAPSPPPHPLQFVLRRLLHTLTTQCGPLLGQHQWVVDPTGLWVVWPATGGHIVASKRSEDGEVQIRWLVVDPSGSHEPFWGAGRDDDAAEQLAAVGSAFGGTPPGGRCTMERYWELVDAVDIKLEWHEGTVYAMAGGTDAHGYIASRIISALGRLPAGCRAGNSDIYLDNPDFGLRFADVFVICGRADKTSEPGKPKRTKNPSVVFEVLSPGTEAADRGVKRLGYFKIPTLKQYILVCADRIEWEVWTRTPSDDWALTVHRSGTVRVEGVDIDIADTYAWVDRADLAPTSLP